MEDNTDSNREKQDGVKKLENIQENQKRDSSFENSDIKEKSKTEIPKNDTEEEKIKNESSKNITESKENKDKIKNEQSNRNNEKPNDSAPLPEKNEVENIAQNNEQNNLHGEQNIKRYRICNIYTFGILIAIFSIIIALIIIRIKNNKKNPMILDDNDSELFIEEDIDYISNKNYKAIISIDFGSSFSGFAIAFGENSIESKSENIQPTTIVITKNNLKGYRFGYDAENFMNEPRSEEYIYFDRIKTKLDPKFKNNVQSKIYIDSKYPPNYKINLRIIITEYLRMFSDNALKYYNQKGYTKYTKDDIKWIVTVPAIWNEYGKQFMRNCAKKAGMKKIIIALEPEAASLTMFKDDNVDEKYKEKGKIFMLIDAGGYTLDITINEIVDNQGNLKQLSPPSGGAYGSMNINDYLIKLVEEIFTKEKIDDLRKNRYDLWKITLDSIEKKKKELRDDESDAPNYKIDIRLENNCEPGFFSWIFGKKCSKIISYGKVEYDNKYLYIPKNIMRQILLKNINKIIEHIKKLIRDFPNIDLMVLTGGFSKCNLLKEEIKRNFNYPYKELIDPEVSIMRGAAIYGIQPNQIVSRKSPYTIGTNKYTYKEEGTECRNQKKGECQYFDIFIRKGYDIKNNQEISHVFTPLYENQTSVHFPLYFSKNREQLYIDENIFKVSEFSMQVKEMNIPREERRFELKMEFGSCITVSGKNLVSGEKIKIFANYYNRND